MFDFDELPDEVEAAQPPPAKPTASVVEAKAGADEEGKTPVVVPPAAPAAASAAAATAEVVEAAAAEVAPSKEAAPRDTTSSSAAPPVEAPNAKFLPGMRLESISSSILREQEALESQQVGRLLKGTQVEVLTKGTGPTGKRLKVNVLSHDNVGKEGWVSVISSENAQLWKIWDPVVVVKKAHDPGRPAAPGPAAKGQLGAPLQKPSDVPFAKPKAQPLRSMPGGPNNSSSGRPPGFGQPGFSRPGGFGQPPGPPGGMRPPAMGASKFPPPQQRPAPGAQQQQQQQQQRPIVEGGYLQRPGAQVGQDANAMREKATDGFSVGDTWKVLASSLAVREHESLYMADNQAAAFLDPEEVVEILAIGRDPSGRLVKIRANSGVQGWISVETALGEPSLKPVKRKGDPELWTGSGNTLGGSAHGSASSAAGARGARAAALEAAERRQTALASKGVGEAKAKALLENDRRETLLRKIGDICKQMREEVPLAIQTASVDALQKHYDFLTKRQIDDPSSPSRTSPLGSTFQPPARSGQHLGIPRSAPEVGEASMGGLDNSRAPAPQQLDLSQEQWQAVFNLEALGFPRAQALEAYIACDGNQEMAANLLFENPVADDGLQVRGAAASLLPAAGGAAHPGYDDEKLSLREWQAVQRLEELGFDRPTSLRAYLAYGRDEEAAGNALLF